MSVEKNSACGMTPCSISLIRTTAANRAMLEPVDVPPLVSRPSPSRSVDAPPAAPQPLPFFCAIQKLKTLFVRGSATARWPSEPGAISVSAGIGTALRSGPYWLGLMENRGVLAVIFSAPTRVTPKSPMLATYSLPDARSFAIAAESGSSTGLSTIGSHNQSAFWKYGRLVLAAPEQP